LADLLIADAPSFEESSRKKAKKSDKQPDKKISEKLSKTDVDNYKKETSIMNDFNKSKLIDNIMSKSLPFSDEKDDLPILSDDKNVDIKSKLIVNEEPETIKQETKKSEEINITKNKTVNTLQTFMD